MPLYSKQSLETLKQRIDLVEVLSGHMDLKRAGSSYKGLCPFHDEKSPSFMVQKGDSHYHCFGCGAHGDAIQFLMTHARMSFQESVENLAERFGVHLEQIEGFSEKKGPSKTLMKEVLEKACRFYHFMLLHTQEGHEALCYLHNRGIDNAFVQQFQIGWAPSESGIFRKTLHQMGATEEILLETGLLKKSERGSVREFFSDRILFPIHEPSGAVVGFSGRKYKEKTFGGKYVNTPETPLFKKSRTLYGLNYCRKTIAKERRAIIVEGQIDALRLIQEGLTLAVAGQGTAFGEGHVKELVKLGIEEVYLAFDSDQAGLEAARKVGNLFQKEGIGVRIVDLPGGMDPDSYLQEHGKEGFSSLLNSSRQYLPFLVDLLSVQMDLKTPAGKNALVQTVSSQIRDWEHPLMVHEGLRQLAQLTQVPEAMVGVGQEHIPNIHIRKQASIGLQTIDPDRILESDLLRWLLLMGEGSEWFVKVALDYLPEEAFRITVCRQLYRTYIEHYQNQKPRDILSLAVDLDDAEGQLVMSELLHKKVNRDRAQEQFTETIQKILDRNWMEERERIKVRMHSGQCSDDEVMELAKEFDALKRNPPRVQVSEEVYG